MHVNNCKEEGVLAMSEMPIRKRIENEIVGEAVEAFTKSFSSIELAEAQNHGHSVHLSIRGHELVFVSRIYVSIGNRPIVGCHVGTDFPDDFMKAGKQFGLREFAGSFEKVDLMNSLLECATRLGRCIFIELLSNGLAAEIEEQEILESISDVKVSTRKTPATL